ncbi:hypothetical protein Vretimale_5731 [Volvox reticuliferus]|uniref:Centrosomal protein of 70 kDa n=2 Tax=Volvox reticuliferus TaxID=1737510 RepID=A0A8J4G680_9CHLO|nr:hypothetical protein Vretimale_5731 [Volvox reticuliferus]
MADASEVEERVVSVFNSDDDLTNFLAGLRAKYASLYPQYVEAEHSQSGAEVSDGRAGATSSVLPGPGFAGDGFATANAAGEPALGTCSQSFEEKISQLRSSLQSLQHILPSRTSTTANLLDSFIAVSGDRKMVDVADEQGVEAVTVMDRMLPDDANLKRYHGVADATAAFVLLDTAHSDVVASEPVPMAINHSSTCRFELKDETDIAMKFQVQPVSASCIQPAANPETATVTACSDRGPCTISALVPSVGEGDAAPSDAAFVELAAGYVRSTLQSPSNEASGSSFDGSAGAPTAHPHGPARHAGEPGGELTLGGAFPALDETLNLWGANGQGGTWQRPVQTVTQESWPHDLTLGPPIAAALTFYPVDDPQQPQQAGVEAGINLSAQQLQDSEVPGFASETCHPRSQATAAWRHQLGHSPGRRRTWQLVGLGCSAVRRSSPQQCSPSQASARAGCVSADASGAVSAPAAGEIDCGVAGWPAGAYLSAPACSDVPLPVIKEADSAATRESSAGWESVDDSAVAGRNSVGGETGMVSGSGWQPIRLPSTGTGSAQVLDAAAQPVNVTSTAATLHTSVRSNLGSCDGGDGLPEPHQSILLQLDASESSATDDWGQQQFHRNHLGPYSAGASELLPSAAKHLMTRDNLAPPPQVQDPSPQHPKQQHLVGAHLPQYVIAGDLEPLVPDKGGITAQQPSSHAHPGSALQDSAAGENYAGNESARNFEAVAGGMQRQRRRWGSPQSHVGQQLNHNENRPHGSAWLYTSLDAAATASRPDNCNSAQGLLDDRAGRASSPSGCSGDVSWRALGGHASLTVSLTGLEPESHCTVNVMGVMAAAANENAVGDGSLDLQPSPSAQGLTIKSTVLGSLQSSDGTSRAGPGVDDHSVEVPLRSRNAGQQRPLRLLPPQQPAPIAATVMSHDASVSPRPGTALVLPTPQLEQLRQQTSVDLGLPSNVPCEQGTSSSSAYDEVLCGSPTEAPQQQKPPATDAPGEDAATDWNLGTGIDDDRPAAAVPDPVTAHSSTSAKAFEEAAVGSGSHGITANRGGIAFSISATGDVSRRLQREWVAKGPAWLACGTADALSVQHQPTTLPPAGFLGPGDRPGPADWERLNKQLREAGFSGLAMVQSQAGPAAVAHLAAPEPEPTSLHRCLSSVLDQYVRRNRLVAELLVATEQSGRIAEQQEAAIRHLKREANAARATADKARRELADMSSQQMPKVEARHAAQLGRLRSEAAKLKEALRVSELDLSAKSEEIRSLRATITGLQCASSHNTDVAGAMLRQRVAQLEAMLRSRDKEMEKLKTTKEVIVGQAEDGQANALDRAYEAETTAHRLEMEVLAARTRIGQLEQGLRQRDRDVAAMREDLQQIKACEAAATLVAQERSASAEEAARRAESEATVLRGKVKELEGAVRAARQELEKQHSEAEALRSRAYEAVYRLEDESRTLGAELEASRTRITQLEHVIRAKERDVARTKDEKEAAKAAERERSRVAEEVAVKLEAELTTAKVRLTQAEGAVRTRERELTRLAELLRQTQGAEVEAWLKRAKLEEGSRKMENDFTSLRLRVLQLEAAVKGRDKECEKLARTVESLRAEAHELTAKLAKAEEAIRKAEADLATSRGKVLSMEGQVRVKEREQERLIRVLERLKAGDAEVASRQTALEEAARRLDGQLTAARGRVAALEGVVRARDAAVERLNRQLEVLKTADFERTAQALKSEEAARQQEAEVTAMRQRIMHLEGQLRNRERELERGAREIDAAGAAEAAAVRRLADTAATMARLESEVAAGRQRAAQLGEALRGREREVAALTRALEARKAAEHEANVMAGRTEEAARKLDDEAVELRQRLIQAEGQLRTREREAERQARVLEAAQIAAADAAMRQGEAEATARRMEADAAGLRQRLAQAEGTVRTRDKELERAEKAADQAKEAEAAAEAKLRAAEGTVVQLDGELSSLRLRITQLEAAARGHSKEMHRLTRAMDQSKVAQADASTRAQRSDESARQVASELASARSRLAKLEAALVAREQEAQRVQRLLVAAEAQAATQVLRSEDFVRRVETDLETMRQRAGQLAQLIRSRDRDLKTLRDALEAAQATEAKVAEQYRQSEEALRKVEGELTAERHRAVQLEGQVKTRDREVERLCRQLDTGRDQSNSAAVAAGREASILKDAAAKAEATLTTTRARVTQLESELLAKERQLEGLQRLVGNSRAGDAEAAAAAEERAHRAEEAARRLDAELGAVRQRCAYLEHTFRGRETTLDKLRAVLAEKVAQEERRVARDKTAYQRIRAAYVATLGSGAGSTNGGNSGAGTQQQQQQQRAAGAIAAAARELRPVEIVGLYETRREAAEQELAGYRAEVRSLADQLREAQNHIAIKDRTGAWRTPTDLADMQARIILLERRSADLQRELDRARLEAAEAARMAERRHAELEHRAEQLKEDNEALVHELDSRPTIQDNRTLKREVEILEKRLLQLKGSTATSGAGANAEGGETALSLAAAAKGPHGGSMLTTSQRIARDRSLHRLGLHALDDWPKDVLVDLVQDVCIELDLRDATVLPSAIRKTLRVVGAVPRMEAFIGAVCERVYLKGAPFVPPHIDGTTDPSKVLEVLEIWLELLHENAQLRGAMRAVVETLAARVEGMTTPVHGPGDVVASVRQLVEAEAMALTARESLAAASQHMAREPEHLLSRLVSHFMRLFDCKSLDGVVPAVNRLYVALNEQRNFINVLASTLDLPTDAGATACMARVRELVDLLAQRNHDGVHAKSPRGNCDTTESPGPLPSATLDGGIDSSTALDRLMSVFNVRTARAAADAADKAVTRLKKLDEVLPRYQRLASQLIEMLRVTSLEEIIPTLRMVLR